MQAGLRGSKAARQCKCFDNDEVVDMPTVTGGWPNVRLSSAGLAVLVSSRVIFRDQLARRARRETRDERRETREMKNKRPSKLLESTDIFIIS